MGISLSLRNFLYFIENIFYAFTILLFSYACNLKVRSFHGVSLLSYHFIHFFKIYHWPLLIDPIPLPCFLNLISVLYEHFVSEVFHLAYWVFHSENAFILEFHVLHWLLIVFVLLNYIHVFFVWRCLCSCNSLYRSSKTISVGTNIMELEFGDMSGFFTLCLFWDLHI